jgi:hypothetical protein
MELNRYAAIGEGKLCDHQVRVAGKRDTCWN